MSELDKWMLEELAQQEFHSEPQDYLIQMGWYNNGRPRIKRVTQHWWHPEQGGTKGKRL